MHYKNGTEARVGDIVVGTGYNVKDSTGKPRTIVGVVIRLNRGSDSCNLQLAHNFKQLRAQDAKDRMKKSSLSSIMCVAHSLALDNDDFVRAVLHDDLVEYDVEYGQVDHFDLASPRSPD